MAALLPCRRLQTRATQGSQQHSSSTSNTSAEGTAQQAARRTQARKIVPPSPFANLPALSPLTETPSEGLPALEQADPPGLGQGVPTEPEQNVPLAPEDGAPPALEQSAAQPALEQGIPPSPEQSAPENAQSGPQQESLSALEPGDLPPEPSLQQVRSPSGAAQRSDASEKGQEAALQGWYDMFKEAGVLSLPSMEES